MNVIACLCSPIGRHRNCPFHGDGARIYGAPTPSASWPSLPQCPACAIGTLLPLGRIESAFSPSSLAAIQFNSWRCSNPECKNEIS